jgi:hypothetical protein
MHNRYDLQVMLLTKRRIVEQVDIYSGTIDGRDREKISLSIGYLFFFAGIKIGSCPLQNDHVCLQSLCHLTDLANSHSCAHHVASWSLPLTQLHVVLIHLHALHL